MAQLDDVFMDKQISRVVGAVKSGKIATSDVNEACWYYLQRMINSQAKMSQDQSDEAYSKFALDMTMYTIHMEASYKLGNELPI